MLKIGDVRYYLVGPKGKVEMCEFKVKFVGAKSYIGACGTELNATSLMSKEDAQAAVDADKVVAEEKQALTEEMMAKMCLVQREVCQQTGQIAVQVCEGVELTSQTMTMIGLRARFNPSLQYFYALRENTQNDKFVEMVKIGLDVLLNKNMLVPVI